MTDTPAAQRRLLEALAALGHTPGGLHGLRLGIPSSIAIALAQDCPELARVMQCLDDLAAAVQADLIGAKHG